MQSGAWYTIRTGHTLIPLGSYILDWVAENGGYRLAIIGSIKDTAMEYEDVAFFAAGYLLKVYPQLLVDRYRLDELPDGALDVLDAVGRKRGCLNKRGVIDYERVARILLTELRSGKLGRITLETPQMAEQEKREVAETLKERAEEKRRKKTQRKARFKESRKRQRR